MLWTGAVTAAAKLQAVGEGRRGDSDSDSDSDSDGDGDGDGDSDGDSDIGASFCEQRSNL